MKIGRRTFLALGIFIFAMPARMAMAQQAPDAATVRLRGSVVSLEGQALVIKSQDGTTASLTLTSATVITTNVKSSLDAIKAGDYVASAAVRGVDGKLHSTELRILPEALRGLGEGQRPMDKPNTMMTNAVVAEVAGDPQGRVLKVKFKDGDSELVVGPDVPISAVVVSDASALKLGVSVMASATKAADGTLTAKRILAN